MLCNKCTPGQNFKDTKNVNYQKLYTILSFKRHYIIYIYNPKRTALLIFMKSFKKMKYYNINRNKYKDAACEFESVQF